MSIETTAPREQRDSVHKALLLAVLLICLAALSGAACGQRGPLYLPAQEPAADTTAAEADAAEDEKDEQEQGD